MTVGTHESTVGRAVLTLSAGTVTALAIGTLSQFLLIAWLSPNQFGLWASANAAMVVIVALVNFGEVNAFLSDEYTSAQQLLASTVKMNGVLFALGMVEASVLFLIDRSVAIVGASVAVQVPFMGLSLACYAIALKFGRLRRIVIAQVSGATAKLGVGITLAWGFHSIFALPISLLVYYAVIVIVLLPVVTEAKRALKPGQSMPRRRRARLSWALQAVTQALPNQADYFVTWLVSTPQLLGVYFIAFQATVGLSALLTGPLLKSSLTHFSATRSDSDSAWWLMVRVCAAVGVVAACCAAGVMQFMWILPTEWATAGPVLLVLLGSLPFRFVAPVADAYLMAASRWNRSWSLNLVDTGGTALAALTALSHDALVLATAVVIWKAAFNMMKCPLAFDGISARRLASMWLPQLTFVISAIVVAWTLDILAVLALICVSLLSLACCYPKQFRPPARRIGV